MIAGANKRYNLEDGKLVSLELSDTELQALRVRLPTMSVACGLVGSVTQRMSAFLTTPTDNHLFNCFACGRFYFNGCDITEY